MKGTKVDRIGNRDLVTESTHNRFRSNLFGMIERPMKTNDNR